MTDATASPSPRLSVLIVGYNSPEWLNRCLDSLLGDGAPSVAFEVVLVDNNSSPPLATSLRSHADQIRLVTLAANVGFANAVNAAAQLAGGQLLLLLNPDTEVLPGAIDALIEFLAADPGRGLVGGRTLAPDGTLDPRSCWAQPTLWSQFCFATLLSAVRPRSNLFNPEAMPQWQRDTPREVGVITGCLLLTTRAAWDQLGGFDSSYFMYGEDVDLSRRARAMGMRPSMTPSAAVIHAGGASSTTATKTLMVLRGKASLYRTGGSPITRLTSARLLVIGVGLRALLEASRHRQRPDLGVWRNAWRRRADWSAGWTSRDRVPIEISNDRSAPI